MRIAVVTPFLPWPADTGGKLRSYYLLRSLAQAHTVDLFTVYYGPRPDPGPLDELFHEVNLIELPPANGRLQRVQRVLAAWPRSVQYFATQASLAHVRDRLARGYDLLISDEISMAPYVEGVAGMPSVPRLIMRQKIDHLYYREAAAARPAGAERWLDWLEARKLQRFESRHMPGFHAAVTCSAEDARVAQAQGHGLPVEIIVNGADTEYFVPQRAPAAAPTLLIVGTMHYYPNIDATLYFFREIYPALIAEQPDLRILIVGHQPPPEICQLQELPGVTVTGSVPDVRPYMSQAWALAVPLRLGGGTRLKIMEALAAELPVVSTAVGAQGIDAVDGEDVLLADEPAEFARRTLALLRDGELRERLAAAGRERVLANFSWQALGERFARFCVQTACRTDRKVIQPS